MEANKRIEYLQQAIEIFQTSEPDAYLTALAEYELSYCNIDLTKAKELADKAAHLLSSFSRNREAQTACTRAKELTQKLTTTQNTSTATMERIGQCLFISPPMRAIRLKLDAIAAAQRDPVLILGPRGCGKELLAQSIHLLSPRNQRTMLAINCAALPEQLIEAELFGYEKGAFTGANTQKRGLFELADNSTLFLDEIGELTPAAQTKLLRVLQTGELRRVGGTTEFKTDVRILAATNRDLDEMAQNGTFREDLLDRLAVWRLRIPPLNRRREEILPLAEEFLQRYGNGSSFVLDSSAQKFLLEKDYPGNVRILENDIRRSIGNARAANTNIITATMVCEDFESLTEFTHATPYNHYHKSEDGNRPISIADIPNYDEAMLNFERELLIRALVACQWNKKLTANALGMSERTFWRAIQRHKLHTRPEDTTDDL
jgi:transcriptional regulator with GAF, ATPase, and Fis domain